jgi:RimJ/RimL family protein N-acetyltransferase
VFDAASSSVAELAPWMPWCQPGYSRGETATFVESRDDAWSLGSEFSFAIEDARTGRLLGSTGLNDLDGRNRRANLGYWVRTDATGRGVARRAARLVAEFGFADVGLLRQEILVAVGNVASQRVAEAIGAVREGCLRTRLVVHGRAHDAFLYALVRPTSPELTPT